MMNENELKDRLMLLRDEEWGSCSNEEYGELAFESIRYIGSVDGELRDELILEYLYHVITEQKMWKEDVRNLLDICLGDDFIFHGIGEADKPSVFKRSFTVLIIRWIVYYHNKFGENLLSRDEMMNVFDKLIKHMTLEKDMRGYVEVGGWAHSIAHCAIGLRTIALTKHIQKDELIRLLEVVKIKNCVTSEVYSIDEEERFVMIVINILSKVF